MAKRYSKQEVQDVLEFVQAYNQENGRGGKAAAAKKFGVNTNSIRNWQAASDEPKVAHARARKPRAAQANGLGAPVAQESNLQILEKMIQIQKSIEGLKAEFADLRSKL
jgi:hypothetical protein